MISSNSSNVPQPPGNAMTTIGDNAFAGCEYLTEVTVPDSVTKIGDNVFYGCTSLESAT